MKTNIDKGRIVKALAGFYYIDDGHEVHQCRAVENLENKI